MAQRIFGLCLGYEDLNDHDSIRDDPALALAVGCADVAGEDRLRQRDKGHPLASSKTLNRLELSEEEEAAKDRFKRTAADFAKMDALLVDGSECGFCCTSDSRLHVRRCASLLKCRRR